MNDKPSKINLYTADGLRYGSEIERSLPFALKVLCFILPLVGLIMATLMIAKGRKTATREALIAMCLGMVAWCLLGLILSE